jgi:hypothetical protein
MKEWDRVTCHIESCRSFHSSLRKDVTATTTTIYDFERVSRAIPNMATIPSQNSLLPIGTQPFLIQEEQTSMSDFFDLPSRDKIKLSRTTDRHKRWRSSPSLGTIHCIGPQQQCEDGLNTSSATEPSVPGDPHFQKDTSKTIRICDCTYSTLPEVLPPLCDSVALSTVDEIHFQNIHRAAVTEDLMMQTSSASSSDKTSITTSIIALLEQTRPKRLILRDCNLQVSDLFAIMEILRRHHSTTLEHLDLRYNGFAPRVLQWIFAIHMGSFHSLREIYLRQGIRCMVHQSVRDAIVECIQKNRHNKLQNIDVFYWDRSIEHILDINCAGRRVLQLDSFPMVLWPLLLERATKTKKSGHNSDRRMKAREASTMYYMLRNAPTLFQSYRKINR